MGEVTQIIIMRAFKNHTLVPPNSHALKQYLTLPTHPYAYQKHLPYLMFFIHPVDLNTIHDSVDSNTSHAIR
jgi:hypothetical protein